MSEDNSNQVYWNAATYGSVSFPPPTGTPEHQAWRAGQELHEIHQTMIATRAAEDHASMARDCQLSPPRPVGGYFSIPDSSPPMIREPSALRRAWNAIVNPMTVSAVIGAAALYGLYKYEVGSDLKGLYWAPRYWAAKAFPTTHKFFDEKTVMSVRPQMASEDARRIAQDFNFHYKYRASIQSHNRLYLSYGIRDVGPARVLNSAVLIYVPDSKTENTAVVCSEKKSFDKKGLIAAKTSNAVKIDLLTGEQERLSAHRYCSELLEQKVDGSYEARYDLSENSDGVGFFGPMPYSAVYQQERLYRPDRVSLYAKFR